MFLIPQKRVWTQQPNGPRPISDRCGLVAAWSPSSRFTVGQFPLAETGQGGIGVTSGGLAYQGAALLATIAPITDYPVVIGGAFTVGNSDGGWIGLGGGSSVYNRFGIKQIASSGAKLLVDVRPTSSGSTSAIYGFRPTESPEVVVNVVAIMRSPTVTSIFVDGVQYADTVYSARALSPLSKFVVGGSVTGGVAVTGAPGANILLAFYGVEDYGDDHWVSVSQNPWQIFRAPDSRIFVPVSAGGVTNESLTADSIATASATVSSPLLTQNHALTGSAITASSTLSSPTLAQNHSITWSAISTAAATLSTPALSSAASNYALTATAISTAAATLSAPALAQNHIITASGITTSQPTLSAPTISGDAYNLTATGIATAAPSLSQPNLAQNHALTGWAIAAGSPVFSTPTLAQQHALLAMGITTGSPTLSTPVLSDGSLPTYTRAPHGRGYRRDMADTIRPKQRNTTRP